MSGWVHYYVHGRGRGHATRTVPVVRALREHGWMVRVFAGEAAEAVFDGDCIPIRSVPPTLSGSSLRIAIDRIRGARAGLRDERPHAVISDGDLPSVFAAKREGIPTIAVGHGLVFAHCAWPPGVDRGAWMRESLKARMASWGADTIVCANFIDLQTTDPGRVRVARPQTTFPSLGALPRARASTSVLCYFRDDNGDGIASAIAELGYEVTLFSSKPRTVPGIRVEPFDVASFQSHLGRCRAVVSSAGSQLISECIALGIPQFAYYRRADDEQKLNVQLLEYSGLGAGTSFESESVASLATFLRDPPCRATARIPEHDVTDSVVEALGTLVPAGHRSRRRSSRVSTHAPSLRVLDERDVSILW